MISRHTWRQDLLWAGFIMLLALLIGLVHQWKLVELSWDGKLPAYLETQRKQQAQLEMPGTKTLSLAQTYRVFQEKKALFLDARSPDDYAELHIPGAINLPLERLEKKGTEALPGIPPGREMVVYCSMLSCHEALSVAEKLESLGYTKVSVFMGGFRAWDEAGYPADTSK